MKISNLLLLVFVSFGCAAIRAQELKKAAVSIGCRLVNEKDFDFNPIGTVEADKWKKEKFNAQNQTSFAAKCRAKDGLRYTFWFEEETYADENDAQARLSKTRELPPQL